MVVTVSKRAEMEERRRKVAAFMLAGRTIREIARTLEVSHALIGKDSKVILQRWQADQVTDRGDLVAVELQRIDLAQAAIWAGIVGADVRLPLRLEAVETFRRLSESRRKLLGLDAPAKAEITGRDGGPIEVDTERRTQAAREIEEWRRAQAALIAQIDMPTE